MSSIPQCGKCKSTFDELRHAPMVLPCNHNLCQLCILNEFEAKNQNICVDIKCNKVSSAKPIKLEIDKKILDIISNLGNQNEVQKIIRQLQDHSNNFKKIINDFQKKHALLIKEIIYQVKDIFLKNAMQVVLSLKQTKYQIDQKILSLNSLQQQISKQQGQIEIPNLNKFLNFQHLELLQELGTKTNNIIDQIQSKFTKNLSEILQQQSNDQEFQILESYVENIIIQEITKVKTIAYNSNNQKSYAVYKKRFSNQIVKVPKTYLDYTQIEQINNQQLVLSGGKIGNKDFIFFDKFQTKNFQMINMRYRHRTVSTKSQVFIISGAQKNKNLEDCEYFNFSSEQFFKIADIEIPVSRFGACLSNKTIQIFGGFSNDVENRIQQYDLLQNG